MNKKDTRNFILNHLRDYQSIDTDEEKSRRKIISFIEHDKQCFDYDNALGHVTGSAFVVNSTYTHTLLTHHKKLNMWVQFGGHSDGEIDTFAVAKREAYEESGLRKLNDTPLCTGIFDVDIHTIPAHNEKKAHDHFDIRILLVADINEPLLISDESHDVQWIKLSDAHTYNTQTSFLRMIEKAKKYFYE
ncbi:MAG: NUDIX hydrolase [Patescibacteria group bacterium]